MRVGACWVRVAVRQGALRLVAGGSSGHVAHAVLPLHLPAVGDLHFQA